MAMREHHRLAPLCRMRGLTSPTSTCSSLKPSNTSAPTRATAAWAATQAAHYAMPDRPRLAAPSGPNDRLASPSGCLRNLGWCHAVGLGRAAST